MKVVRNKTSCCSSECPYHQTRSTVTTGRKNIKLGKNEESCRPYFKAEDSVITKNQTKEGNTNKQHGVQCITRSRITIRGR